MRAIIKFLDVDIRSGISTYMAGGKIVSIDWDDAQSFQHMCKNEDCGIRSINETTHIFNDQNWKGFHPDLAREIFQL
jgi:hypothetical protein